MVRLEDVKADIKKEKTWFHNSQPEESFTIRLLRLPHIYVNDTLVC